MAMDAAVGAAHGVIDNIELVWGNCIGLYSDNEQIHDVMFLELSYLTFGHRASYTKTDITTELLKQTLSLSWGGSIHSGQEAPKLLETAEVFYAVLK